MLFLSAITCTPSSTFFGFMGVAAGAIFCNLGAAYGTAKSGVGIASMGVLRPDLVMKSIMPVVMAGILGIYGIIFSVIITNYLVSFGNTYPDFLGYAHLGSGMIIGLSCLGAGLAIGIVGDAGVRANALENKLFVGIVIILICAEAIGLYGLIAAIAVSSRALTPAQDKTNPLCTGY